MKYYKSITILGLLLALIPARIYALWIYCSTISKTQPEAVALFKTYFAPYLQGRYDTIYLGIAFAMISLAISQYTLSRTNGIWKYLNLTAIILASAMLLLNLFGLM